MAWADVQSKRWSEVFAAIGVSTHSIYAWTKRYGVPEVERKAQDAQSDEMRRLKAELKRVTEERDILKKAAVYFAKTSG
jgi:transposase